jgi:hypothetical protein
LSFGDAVVARGGQATVPSNSNKTTTTKEREKAV